MKQEYVESKFCRRYKSVDALKEALLENKFLCYIVKNEIKDGNAFLAVRDNVVTIYYKGRALAYISSTKKDCEILGRLLPVTRSLANKGNKFSVSEWQKKTNLNLDFFDVKKEIIDHAICDASSESECVSKLYAFNPFCCNGNWLLIDIEAAFSYSKYSFKDDDCDKQDNRIDLVLYNQKLRQLFFVEVKRLVDNRLDNPSSIDEQMNNYQQVIKHEKNKIVENYNNVIAIFNSLTGKKIDSIDPEKSIPISLVITEFTKKDKDKMKGLNLINKNYAINEIGNFSSITEQTLDKWLKSASKLL